MWGLWIVVWDNLQDRISTELPQGLSGMAKTKSFARTYVWWPYLDSENENLTKSCTLCQASRNKPIVALLHPWTWPAKPWQRIHVDFTGSFQGRMFLIIVAAHSLWPEVLEMSSTTATAILQELWCLLAAYVLQQQVVSENRLQSVWSEFKTFMKADGIKHILCEPYHPSSNGAAKRFCSVFQEGHESEWSRLLFSSEID